MWSGKCGASWWKRKERKEQYASAEGQQDLRGKTAIVVDDGIATGATALVAIRSVRALGASAVLLATPVASHQAVAFLTPEVDELVALDTPSPFWAIGFFYQDCQQVSDDDVRRYLHLSSRRGVMAGTPHHDWRSDGPSLACRVRAASVRGYLRPGHKKGLYHGLGHHSRLLMLNGRLSPTILAAMRRFHGSKCEHVCAFGSRHSIRTWQSSRDQKGQSLHPLFCQGNPDCWPTSASVL
jgi:Phosphoribosyl transferase domain